MEELARWRPVHVLGSGAFGQVHLAWDTADRRYVAVKHFTGQDELDLLRFVIESRIRVAHPHLVRTVAFRLVDDQAWLVTELARGGSLRPMLNRGRQPVGWVAEVVDQTLDALAALHAAGVVHRDVKPANLLLRDAGLVAPYVLVGDFGIAAWRTVSMTGAGAAIGTLGYLAPEYLNGAQPSPQTDLFAVGVLAAELLSGHRLIHLSNSTPDLPADWDHEIPLPDGLPTHLANVLRRMADPDPSRRYTDCVQAREALLHAYPPEVRQDLTAVEAPDLLKSAPTTEPAPTQRVSTPPQPMPAIPPPPVPTRRKRRFPWAVTSGVVALAAAAAGLILWLGNESPPPSGAVASSSTPEAPAVAWTPAPLEPCSRVDIGRLRQNDTQRCQRTSATAQSWVTAPKGGFPARSNPAGPFAGEPCEPENTQDNSPTGTPLTCHAGKWS